MNLEYLEISHNATTFELSSGFFEHLSSLTRLFLYDCDFKSVPSDVLKSLVNLQFLNLSNSTNSSHIDLGVLNELKWLHLVVNGFDLPIIGSNLAQKLFSLDYKRTEQVLSDEIDPVIDVLQNFDQLEHLSLQNNNYSHYDLDLLSRLKNLRCFRMNKFFMLSSFCAGKTDQNEIDSSVMKNNHRHHQNLYGNFFENLEIIELKQNINLNDFQCVRLLPNLKSLILSHGKLECLDPRMFRNMPNLTKLDLSSNKLKAIKKQTFSDLNQLKSLMLSSNFIEELEDECFESCSSLEVLDLSWNKICRITHSTFRGLFKLRDINLSFNIFKQNTINAICKFEFFEKESYSDNLLVLKL